MAYRPHGHAGAQVPGKGPLGICDRCGFLYFLNDLVWQYDYQGGQTPQNLRLLVCRRTCLDDLNYNNKLLILPPDPPPIFNARPEFYDVDETNWLTTQDEDIIDTQSGDPLITSIPNPDSVAGTADLLCSISAPSGSVAVAYLDLFSGDPSSGGISVLADITGSSTRTNIASDLTTTLGIATNTAPIVITAASVAATNVRWVGIYDAASGGTLLMSGAVGSAPTVFATYPVQFDALGLSIDLN